MLRMGMLTMVGTGQIRYCPLLFREGKKYPDTDELMDDLLFLTRESAGLMIRRNSFFKIQL